VGTSGYELWYCSFTKVFDNALFWNRPTVEGLDARLRNLLSKKVTIKKVKEVQADSLIQDGIHNSNRIL
jgi:hypothetical protein